MFAKSNLKDGNGNFSQVQISRDRTNRERHHLNTPREELQKRSQEGEENLTIKYRNGVPAFVVQPKNDWVSAVSLDISMSIIRMLMAFALNCMH